MNARPFLTLMQREWLQHRFAWMLLLLAPLGLALLLALFDQVEFDSDMAELPAQLPLLLALVPAVAGTALMLAISLFTSFVIVVGLARRDHGDRSFEFWLSLPVPLWAALGVPLVVHLLALPAVAMLLGWLSGQALGVLLVGRVAGLAALADVPWTAGLVATLSLLLRFVAGLPMAVLWVLPIILLLMLMNAWFKRWGFVVAIVGAGLLNLVNQLTTGQRWLFTTAGELLRHAGLSLMGAGGGPGLRLGKGDDGVQAMLRLPGVALHDFGAAVAALASPLFVGGLVFSAACFALLLRWRQTGAGRAD